MGDLQSYISQLLECLNRNETVILACNCEISYSGRAESFLPQGDRVIIIKSDKAVIVHQPQGNAPVNYMKPGTTITTDFQNGRLMLRAHNLSLKEYLDLAITKIHFFNNHKLEDNHSIQLAGSEKDMAEMIYNQPELIEKDFKPVSMEEQTKYGFIDVFGTDKNNILTVVECKRYTADLNAVTQLRRYVEKLKESKGIENVRGILASPTISKNAKQMLEDWGFQHKAVIPPKHLERYNKDQQKLGDF